MKTKKEKNQRGEREKLVYMRIRMRAKEKCDV
jgi:hypothetical protein